jgi:hypothetical protein
MAAIEGSYDGSKRDSKSPASRFMPMFQLFREELDQHHDRRERIAKASRDITALSKKMSLLPRAKICTPLTCGLGFFLCKGNVTKICDYDKLD